jgi:hypothetical protein
LTQTQTVSGPRGELIASAATIRALLCENAPYALAASLGGLLVLLYVRGMWRAYRAAGDDWQDMDRDVRVVFLLAVPLFRGAITVLVLADRIFYAH